MLGPAPSVKKPMRHDGALPYGESNIRAGLKSWNSIMCKDCSRAKYSRFEVNYVLLRVSFKLKPFVNVLILALQTRKLGNQVATVYAGFKL